MARNPQLVTLFLFLYMQTVCSLSFAREFRKISCDLSTKTPLPKIIIVGETHDDLDSIKIRKELLDGGATGKFPLASELGEGGFAFLPFAKKEVVEAHGGKVGSDELHGIESIIPHSITVSYYGQDQMIYETAEPVNILYRLSYYILNFPLQSAAFERVRKRSLGGTKGISPLVEKMEHALEEMRSSSIPSSQVQSLLKKHFAGSMEYDQFRNFVSEVHKEVINIANQKYLPLLGRRGLISYLNKTDSQAIGLKKGSYTRGTMAYNIFLPIRDRDFSHNIADVICDYSGKFSHIVVLAGSLHVPGMVNWLDKLSSSRLEVLTFDSSDKKTHESTLAEIGKIRGITTAGSSETTTSPIAQ